MRLPFRGTLLSTFVICSIAIGCIAFIPTYLVGLRGVNNVVNLLEDTLHVHIQSLLTDFADAVQGENDQFLAHWNLDVVAEGHEQLKRRMCSSIATSSKTVYANFAREADGYFLGCQKNVNFTSGEVLDYRLNVRNSSDWTKLFYIHLDPVDFREKEVYKIVHNYDPRKRPWYITVNASQAWSDPYLYTEGLPVGVTAGLPLQRDGSRYGVYAVDIIVDSVSNFLTRLNYGANGASMILDARTGEVLGVSWSGEAIFNKHVLGGDIHKWEIKLKKAENITHSLMRKAIDKLGGTSAAVVAHKQLGKYHADNAAASLFDVKDDHGLWWRIIVVVDSEEFTSEFTVQRTIVIIVICAILLPLITSQTLLANTIVQSLSILTRRMDNLEISIAAMEGGQSSSANAAAQGLVEVKRSSGGDDPNNNSTSLIGSSTSTESLGTTRFSNVEEIAQVEQRFQNMSTTIRSFARFVPREVVCDLLSKGELAEVRMSPAMCTVQFVDIENFTRMSELVDTVLLADMMEAFFDIVTDLIHDHGGSVDKYIGDCVMSVWGAPMAVDHMNMRGCACALKIIHATNSPRLQNAFAPTGLPLRVRIGLHSGDVLAGNMGGKMRLNYTLIGASVNLAARLEALNKEFGTTFLTSDTVFDDIESVFVTRLVHHVIMQGFDTGAWVYEVVGLRASFAEMELDPNTLSLASVLANREKLSQHQTSASSNPLQMSSDVGPNVPVPAYFGGPLTEDIEVQSLSSHATSTAASQRAGKHRPLRTARSVVTVLEGLQQGLPVCTRDDEEYCNHFSSAVRAFFKRDFRACLKKIEQCERIVPATRISKLHKLYRDECTSCMGSVLPDSWTGTLVLNSK